MPVTPPDLRVFIGFDPRQPVAYHVCRASIERHTTHRLSIEPLVLARLPITRKGLTEFTYSRFLVPYLCDFSGPAVFLDADVVVRADLIGLLNNAYPSHAVSVVQSTHRFEWASVMVFNCLDPRCHVLTPEYVDNSAHPLFDFAWAGGDAAVGSLPPEWNHLVYYDAKRPDWDPPRLVHYTAGIPCWPETKSCDYAEYWHEEFRTMVGTVSWEALMGQSVHRDRVKGATV